MKLFLLNLFIFLGVSKVYANTESIFLKKAPRVEAAEAAGGCEGCRECGGTERPSGGR